MVTAMGMIVGIRHLVLIEIKPVDTGITVSQAGGNSETSWRGAPSGWSGRILRPDCVSTSSTWGNEKSRLCSSGREDPRHPKECRRVGAGPNTENEEAVRRAPANDPMARPPTRPTRMMVLR